MALSKIIFSLLPFFGSFPVEVGGQMLYFIHRQDMEKAFQIYLDHSKEMSQHDFALLNSAASQLLKQGIESSDKETQLMSIFGAGIAMSQDLICVLEKGIYSKDLKTQVIALNYLGKLHDDEADQLLLEALSSPFLLTRLEALLELSKKNYPEILGHLKALMTKVPDEIRPVFAQIAVHLEGPEANTTLRQLLNDPAIEVRLGTILAISEENRDDFLPQIRKSATSAHHAEQECAAFALGILKDNASYSLLEELTKKERAEIRLAAAISLYQLGKKEALKIVEKEALNGNLFAIYSLGKLNEGRQILEKLAKGGDRDIRLNATLSLLEMKVFTNLEEFLITSPKDLGYTTIHSAGGGLKAWKTVASASQKTKTYPGLEAKTIGLKEKILVMALECPEEDFLKTARLIIKENQVDLIPLMVELLRNRKSEAILQILKEGQQKAGSPFIRNYCTLALYRMKEEGPYEEMLVKWVLQTKEHPLIQFRESEEEDEGGLTPDETSSFLVEVFETLAASQNQTAIEALLHAIAYGNPKNRYALAGLLIKAIE